MSQLIRSKLTKKIFFQDEEYVLSKVLGKGQYFLLDLKTGNVDEDGGSVMEKILIDPHNDEFYPSTPKVRKLMGKKRELEAKINDLNNELQEIWLECFKE